MKAWLIQHQYACSDMLRRFRRQPMSYVLNILVVAVALTLPLTGYTLLYNLQPLARSLAADPEISVFMQVDANADDAAATAKALHAQPGVAGVQYIPRNEALARMQQQTGLAEVLAALPGNPLPDAFVLRIKAAEGDLNAQMERMAEQLRQLPKVAHVQIDSDWVKRLDALLRFLRLAVVVLAVTLGAAIMAVVFNTIRLQVLTQRDEIEVSRLFGATGHFIRRPFIYMGAAQGVLGALLALILVGFALGPLNQSLGEFTRLYLASFQFRAIPWAQMLAWLGGAALLGWLASILSVNRHLAKLD
ncbi:MAG: ABC transporter permease [Burkholderiaceae bacterium]|nr:MAG: ABC transporter permease [Burkholderiaceae bacterium]